MNAVKVDYANPKERHLQPVPELQKDRVDIFVEVMEVVMEKVVNGLWKAIVLFGIPFFIWFMVQAATKF